MPLRFRRSIKIGPGVRLNLNKKSIGITAGRKGIRYTVNSSGRATRTVGLPGTGLWATSSSKIGGSHQSQSTKPAAVVPSAAKQLPRPGLLAPSAEKRFYEGVQAYLLGDMSKALAAFEAASAGDTRNVSDDLFAGLSAHKLGDNAKAIHYLERVVAGNIELPDALMQKYLPATIAEVAVSVSLTPLVSAVLPVSSLGACLMLAEIYRDSARLEDAIGLLQQLHDDNPEDLPLRVALCDLLFDDSDFDAVIATSDAVSNDSDLALACLLLRGKALGKLGLHDAAIVVLSGALKKTSGRDGDLLKDSRYERAAEYQQTGKAALARRDLERIFAEDPSFRNVTAQLGMSPPPPAPPVAVPDAPAGGQVAGPDDPPY